MRRTGEPVRRLSIQTEVLASLSLVMGMAIVLLVTLAFVQYERQLRDVIGRTLVLEARAPGEETGVDRDASWWRLAPDGGTEQSLGTPPEPLDAESRRLAEEALASDRALLRPGAVWQRIRFAAPQGDDGGVWVARLSDEFSWSLRTLPLLVLAGIGLGHVVAFSAVGILFLRRRVVQPLEDLARGARRIAEDGPGLSLPLDAPVEVAEVADAFNEMSQALVAREQDLEKAIVDLRAANQEIRQTQQGLARAEKLALVGRFAAGVAHEVGNPMGAILTYIELASRDEGIDEASRDYLKKAAREGGRVGRILRQLLDTSRPPRYEPVPVDLTVAIGDARSLIAAQPTYRHLTFEEDCDPTAPQAWADASLVMQVLLNLLINAAEATRGVSDARIRLSVRPAAGERRRGESGPPPSRRHPDAVECVVADTGVGIPPADRERIFDPFFTTRDPGDGTGLGLSVALRLAEDMAGSLALVEPPEGFRTALALRLPLEAAAGAENAGGGGVRAGAAAQGAADSAASCGRDPHGGDPGSGG
jgi:signal transduction histidine kinase